MRGGLRWWRFREYDGGVGGDGVGCGVGNSEGKGGLGVSEGCGCLGLVSGFWKHGKGEGGSGCLGV